MPSKSAINASLMPELTAFSGAQARMGRYRSASDVVRAALRLLLEQARRQGDDIEQQKPTAGDPDAR